MPLIDPDEPEERMNALDEASAYFLRAIKLHYTRDTAVEVMEALTPVLGKDWKGRVIFGLMANKHTGIRRFRILLRGNGAPIKKIQAIKEVRHVSGLGLAEAKFVVEAAYNSPQFIDVKQMPIDTSPNTWDTMVANSINSIRQTGFDVEIA